MAVHIFDAEDSDGDSWLEVLEGSPGPSVQNSKVSILRDGEDTVDSTNKTASWVADDTWVSDFEDYNDIKGDYGTGKDASTPGADMESPPPYNCAKDKARLVTDPHHIPSSAFSQFDQRLRLDRPEVGDIKRHFIDVQNLATARPRKGLYYRLWLCWMYRMEWPQIEHTAQHAPDNIIQVVNYWFGLRNHPFWTASDKCPYQWYAMYGSCLDIWKWWDQRNADVGDDGGNSSSWSPMATNARLRGNELTSTYHSGNQYSTFYGRIVGRDDIRPDSATLHLHEYTSTTPLQVGDALSFVIHTYRSFGIPRLEQIEQGAIPFQTWIHWMHQVNLQPSSKQWAGHDLWPSSSSSTLSLTPNSSSQAVALRNISDVAHAYVKEIGLPYKAASYYQSVSYI